MQRLSGRLLLSASDLINHLECGHLSALDEAETRGQLGIPPERTDATDLIARKGDEHERRFLQRLVVEGRSVTRIVSGSGLAELEVARRETVDAMRSGVDVVYQAALFDGVRWRGYSDFLMRVERPSALGPFSYEVADTKLAHRVKPYFLLQLCFYSELVQAIQGTAPRWMHVVLGTGEAQAFRLGDYAAYYRRVKRDFDVALEAGLPASYPEPVDHCGVCRWESRCVARRDADDHLSLVARIQRTQRVRLVERGIETMLALARADDAERPRRIGAGTFEALRAQARLQTFQRDTGELRYELLAPQDDCGFARLPRPCEGDVFFDMEGDPFFDEGLEYLFGAVHLDGGVPVFRAFWATDRTSERLAFEAFVDFVMERRRRFPEMHVYHYAPYEETALKRLMGRHATREDEIDELLRNEVLVDLYTVVRQALRASQPNYSIKSIEAFYRGKRDTAVAEGGDSIIAFEEFLDTGDRSLLEAIERYNEDDCVSTFQLREWLLELRGEAMQRFGRQIGWRPAPDPWEPDAEAARELSDLQAALLADVPEAAEDRRADQQACWLMAELLDYHRREAKPGWWAYFDRVEADDEQLIEVDNEALGGMTDTGIPPPRMLPPSRSLIHTLSFPPQEHKITPGNFIDPATEKGVSVESVDEESGQLRIRRAAKREKEPLPRALIPGTPYNTTGQREALRRLANEIGEREFDGAEGRYEALKQILRRERPSTSARPSGELLQAGAFDLAEAERIAETLRGSYLFIQGPPGSGKTYTGAHLILRLIAAGNRVGVAAPSHAAIHNLLAAMETHAPTGASFRGIKKFSDDRDAYESDRGLIENSKDLGDFVEGGHDLLAGTAWLFSDEALDSSLDYLVIDEAGQVSLADALAMGTCARNLILLGDPQQLAHVSQAIHPPGTGCSVLEHLLGEDTTVPPDRGLFVDQTRRMHPDVCTFISKVIYDERLDAADGCELQRVAAPGELSGTGLRHISVTHEGNTRSSPEEATAIAVRIEDLLHGTYTHTDHTSRPLEASDIMVVAPYNAQVRCLRDQLPDGIRIGTVDKFQGQEAAVCFFSMATSSGQELPRNVEFLFSRNRLNVAISRARCLAILVYSPELLRVRCRNIDQMRLINALGWFVETCTAAVGY